MTQRDFRIWFGAAVFLTLAAICANLWLAQRLRAFPLFRPGDTFPLPVGRALDGTEVSVDATHNHDCYIVRYASAQCPFCAADLPVFTTLEDELGRYGCVTWLLAPSPELFPRPIGPKRVNLTFLDVSSARALHLAETPTTMVLNGTGVIEWSKVGALEPVDVDAARAAIQRRR